MPNRIGTGTDHIRSIRLIALNNAISKDFLPDDAIWRRIARYYSKNFNTPLHLIDTLPRLDVIQTYYEDVYESLEDNDLHQELESVLTPPDSLSTSVKKEKEDAEMDALAKQLQEENKGKVPTKEEEKPIEIEKISQELLDSLDGLGQTINDIKESFEEDGFSLDPQRKG